MTEAMPTKEQGATPRRRIQSIEIGFRLVRVLEAADGPMPLKQIAAATRMSPSKAYVYLATFIHEGIVAQDRDTGYYGLGNFSAQLGLAALRQADVVMMAKEELSALRDKTRCATCLAIWANRGPSIALKFDGDRQGSFVIRLGHVLSLQHSATGRVFMAYLPSTILSPVIEWENAAGSVDKALFARDTRAAKADVGNIRKQGYSTAEHEGANGFGAISTPIFDYSGQMVAAITLLGPKTILTPERQTAFIPVVQEAAQQLSSKLGHHRSLTVEAPAPATPLRATRLRRA
jgi:DNA-binding IclR family transcriptional regulator